MKRFIRYLYEYENEKRVRNVGFIKVETRCEETIVNLQAKGFHDWKERKLVLYLFFEDNGKIIGIPRGEMNLTVPVLSWKYMFTADDVGGQEWYSKICGVLVETGSGRRLAATWDDRCVDVSRICEAVLECETVCVGRQEERDGQTAPEELSDAQEEEEDGCQEERDGQTAPEELPDAQEEEEDGCQEERDGQTAPEELPDAQEEEEDGCQETNIGRRLKRISRQDISNLPRCEWKLANNRFLIHGYNNFHHLLLIDNGNYLKLGVPGIYHIKEAECAERFGFEEFVSYDELREDSEVLDNSQENGDSEDGEIFGYWCRLVRRGRKM